MAKVDAGLKQLAKRDNLPAGEYEFLIDRIGVTKSGKGEGAYLKVTKAPDDELIGKRAYLYLFGYHSDICIGLTQLLASKKLLEMPSGEYGENDSGNLKGLKFMADVTIAPDENGNERNNVTPQFDTEWLEMIRNLSEEDFDEMLAKEKGRGSKKKASKKARR